MTLHAARLQFEREYVIAVLERNHWRIPEAARMLGIHRANLYRTMRRLHISRDSTPGAGGISFSFTLVDPGMAHADPCEVSVADRTRQRRSATLRARRLRFKSDTE